MLSSYEIYKTCKKIEIILHKLLYNIIDVVIYKN